VSNSKPGSAARVAHLHDYQWSNDRSEHAGESNFLARSQWRYQQGRQLYTNTAVSAGRQI